MGSGESWVKKGLIYSVIDENGEKIGVPVKSSKFGKSVGYNAMQKHFEQSKNAIEKNRIRENIRPIITKAMREADSIDDFKLLLKGKGIGCIFRQNEQGRIYGVTFIDYQNKSILNGSRLGKEFSANVFNDLFQDSPVRNMERAVLEKSSIETNRPNRLTESYGVQPSVGGDSSGSNMQPVKEQKEKEEKRLSAKRKRGRGI